MEETNFNKLNTHQRNKSSINMNSNKHSRNISNYVPIPKDDSINNSQKLDPHIFTEETKETKELKELNSLNNSDKNGKITSENTAFKPKVANLLLFDESNEKGLNNYLDMKEDSSSSHSSKSVEVIYQNGSKIPHREVNQLENPLKNAKERRNNRIKTKMGNILFFNN